MITMDQAERARRQVLGRGFSDKELGTVLKAMPSAIRHMGLVRSLEWLAVGKSRRLGESLHELTAPLLLLPLEIAGAVAHLETCDRRQMFEHHRAAVALYDALATLHRIEEK